MGAGSALGAISSGVLVDAVGWLGDMTSILVVLVGLGILAGVVAIFRR